MQQIFGRVVAVAGLSAGVLLCGILIVTAILHFRRDANLAPLLVSLTAAAVALVSGAALLAIIVLGALLPFDGFRGATADSATNAYFASLLSVPAGVGWGWALSVWRPGMTTG